MSKRIVSHRYDQIYQLWQEEARFWGNHKSTSEEVGNASSDQVLLRIIKGYLFKLAFNLSHGMLSTPSFSFNC